MAGTPSVIFYSWQSDLPNATNWGFIQEALEKAARTIRNDNSLEVQPVIDRDTAGVPGSPDIAQTIFRKIDQAQVFVCDISLINQETANQDSSIRPTPNPNVLIELGYALKALGEKRVIMVFNTAFGKPEHLPFDLRMRRVITYELPVGSEKASERKNLAEKLEKGLRSIFSSLDAPLPGEVIQPISLAEKAKTAIEEARPNQTGLVRQYMKEIANKIAALTPKFSEEEQTQWYEQLVEAIHTSQESVIEFARLAEALAMANATEAAQTLYKGFTEILELYTLPAGFQGKPNKSFGTLAKFLGYELFVTFFSFLIREERWELIAELLEGFWHVRVEDFVPSEDVTFGYICEPIDLLEQHSKHQQPYSPSVQAALLKERHTEGDLAQLVPMEQFVGADFFLFLRNQMQPAAGPEWIAWMPQSTWYMRSIPPYLIEAKRAKYAEKLLRPLGVGDIPTLRNRIAKPISKAINMWGIRHQRHPLAHFDPKTIGSK